MYKQIDPWDDNDSLYFKSGGNETKSIQLLPNALARGI